MTAKLQNELGAAATVGDLNVRGALTPTQAGSVANVGPTLSGNGDTVALGVTGGSLLTGQFATNANGVKIPTFSGAVGFGEIRTYAGDPNGVVTGDAGSVVLDLLTPALWQNTTGATVWARIGAASSVPFNGAFGDGSDGALVLDGAATVLGMVPVANVYTMTRDILASTITVNAGVRLNTANFRVYCKHLLTLTGIISCNGKNAAGTVGGAALSGSLPPSAAGPNAPVAGDGTAGTNTNPTIDGLTSIAGTGGAAAPSVGGAGGTTTPHTNGGGSLRAAPWAVMGREPFDASATMQAGASGGAGGAASFGIQGGGGGGGGGWLVVCAETWTGAGSVECKGGDGGDGVDDGVHATGGGGGGTGGVLVFVTTSATIPPTSVIGGQPGNSFNGGGLPTLAGGGTVVNLSGA